MTGYMAKFLFCILLDFLEVRYFFLVGYAHALKLALLSFKNL